MLRNLLRRPVRGECSVINGLAMICWSHVSSLRSACQSRLASLFFLQRAGTVSVLAAFIAIVSITTLTNREKTNVTNVYGSIEVHKRRIDGDH